MSEQSDKARFLYGGLHRRLCPTFTYTGSNAESVKGGMLMKSKYRANGKKVALCNFYYHLIDDNIPHKSTVAAPLAQERLL